MSKEDCFFAMSIGAAAIAIFFTIMTACSEIIIMKWLFTSLVLIFYVMLMYGIYKKTIVPLIEKYIDIEEELEYRRSLIDYNAPTTLRDIRAPIITMSQAGFMDYDIL